MRRFVIDANALVSFLTDRDLKQQEAVSRYFEEAASARIQLYCPALVVAEFVYVLERVYRVARSRVATIVSDLIAMPGVFVVGEGDLRELLDLWPSALPDFGDAAVAAVCRSTRGSSVLTFDRKFTTALKRAGIPVKNP